MASSGGWIQTYTGRRFWPLEPSADDVCIEDIAHHLALTNRFGGATLRPYSVAEHSFYLSYAVTRKNRLWALLHDAAEAYICDMASPVKRSPAMAEYRAAEARIQRAICDKFGLPAEMPAEVHSADQRFVHDERRLLMATTIEDLSEQGYGIKDLPAITWKQAKKLFLSRFEELTHA